ncbi:MAG: LysR family transcriptional regulator [Psychrilyobacter sp.]|uniref:LysR family transcriptional regulator n=1 Tax=Psychrilyobacter sp. TaxID=2586924 RepID=UPI003C761200
MEIKLLKTFITVVQTLSFSAAAEVLHYSQSSISEQIKKLEINLNTILFERIGNKIKLTSDGKILVIYSKKILYMCDEALMALTHSENDEIKGQLTIAMTETLCFYKLPNLFKEFCELYPNIELKLKIGNCYDFPIWLNNNIIDVAFVLDDEINYANLVTKLLYEEKLMVVASPLHPLAKFSELSLEELKNQTLVLTQKGSKYRAIFEDYLKQQQISYKSQFEFESVEAIKTFIKSGSGIACLPETTVKKDLDSKELIKLPIADINLKIATQVLYHKDKYIFPGLKALLDLVEKMNEKDTC